MSAELHLGHAYPLIFDPQDDSLDGYLADIDITVYAADFEQAIDRFAVVSLDAQTMLLRCTNESIRDLIVPLGDLSWTERTTDVLHVRVLAGYRADRLRLWTGYREIEPTRVVQLAGLKQSVTVYNRDRALQAPRPECRPYEFDERTWVDEDGYVIMCGPHYGDVEFAGGISSRVDQYNGQRQLQIIGDPAGGELGRVCEGQVALHEQEVAPLGRGTLDGASRCNEVLKSINGISVETLLFQGGAGVSVYSQPEKSRVTVRFDGAGLARCPGTEISQAACPEAELAYCGPLQPTDLCPDVPDDLASVRKPGKIPDIPDLPLLRPGLCDPLPSEFKYLALRGCATAQYRWDGVTWINTLRCRPHCASTPPTGTGLPAEIRSVNCVSTLPDPTVGIRNPFFQDDFVNWGFKQPPTLIESHPKFTAGQLPAVELSGQRYIFQTEIWVSHRTVLRFDYFGSVRLILAALGNLCLDVTLDSDLESSSSYIGELVIPAKRPIAVQFMAGSAERSGIISVPYLDAV